MRFMPRENQCLPPWRRYHHGTPNLISENSFNTILITPHNILHIMKVIMSTYAIVYVRQTIIVYALLLSFFKLVILKIFKVEFSNQPQKRTTKILIVILYKNNAFKICRKQMIINIIIPWFNRLRMKNRSKYNKLY